MTARPRGRGLAAACGSILALVLGAGCVAAAEADPSAEEAAMASLLRAEDLPASATTEGPTVVGDADLPGFTENGGLHEVNQTWFAEDPTLIVFDFRFPFPDAASAAAFLDASEEVLGEVSSGARPQPLLVEPLPDTRYYFFEDAVLGTDTVGHDFLMRHENLVAKVYVSGDGPELPLAAAMPIAQAAADRMVAAIGAGPGSLPAGSPPVDSPARDGEALVELLSHIPAEVIDGCTESAPSADRAPEAGEVARVVCPASGEAELTFVLFDSGAAMDAAYDAAVDYAQVFGTLTTAGDCEGGGYEGTWRLGEEEAGRLLCHELGGAAFIVWSHPASNILAMVRHTGGDHAAAWQLWLVAGPT